MLQFELERSPRFASLRSPAPPPSAAPSLSVSVVPSTAPAPLSCSPGPFAQKKVVPPSVRWYVGKQPDPQASGVLAHKQPARQSPPSPPQDAKRITTIPTATTKSAARTNLRMRPMSTIRSPMVPDASLGADVPNGRHALLSRWATREIGPRLLVRVRGGHAAIRRARLRGPRHEDVGPAVERLVRRQSNGRARSGAHGPQVEVEGRVAAHVGPFFHDERRPDRRRFGVDLDHRRAVPSQQNHGPRRNQDVQPVTPRWWEKWWEKRWIARSLRAVSMSVPSIR